MYIGSVDVCKHLAEILGGIQLHYAKYYRQSNSPLKAS